jgi:hypothetical protein
MCIAHAVCDAHVCCASVAAAILHEADACGCNRGCGIIGTLHLTCISFRRLMRRSSESSQAIPYGLRSISISHRSSCAQPLNHVRLFGRAESAESHRPVNTLHSRDRAAASASGLTPLCPFLVACCRMHRMWSTCCIGTMRL